MGSASGLLLPGLCILCFVVMEILLRHVYGFKHCCLCHVGRRSPSPPRRWLFSSSSSSAAAAAVALSEIMAKTTSAKASLDEKIIYPRVPFFKIYYNDIYEVSLPPNHRFPMEKYRKVRLTVQDWVLNNSNKTNNNSLSSSSDDDDDYEDQPPPKIRCEFQPSPLATVEELATTHDSNYIHRFMAGNMTSEEIRNIGFPWSPDVVDRHRSSVGGTVAAACSVVNEWITMLQQQQNNDVNGDDDADRRRTAVSPLPPCWGAHVAGGTHHAFFNYGEGFSVFSDIAVAANVVLRRFPEHVRNILIVDLDVHQGNGNAALFRDRPEVFTFSIQCSANYFSEKQHSDLDIELPIGCTDETYLMTLHHWLGRLRREVDCDLIFFQAGVDVLETDRLGSLSLTQSGVRRRNDMVYQFARDMNVPLVITMGGGYPKPNDWSSIISAHANVYIQAYQFLANELESQVEDGTT